MNYFMFISLYPGSSLLPMSQMVRDSLISDVCIQSPLIQRGWFMETHIFSKFSESQVYFYTLVLYMYISDLMTLFLIMAVPVTSSSILLSIHPSIHPSIHLSIYLHYSRNDLYFEIDAKYTEGSKTQPLLQ